MPSKCRTHRLSDIASLLGFGVDPKRRYSSGEIYASYRFPGHEDRIGFHQQRVAREEPEDDKRRYEIEALKKTRQKRSRAGKMSAEARLYWKTHRVARNPRSAKIS